MADDDTAHAVRRFGSISEEEVAKLLTEKGAKNTRRATETSITALRSCLAEECQYKLLHMGFTQLRGGKTSGRMSQCMCHVYFRIKTSLMSYNKTVIDLFSGEYEDLSNFERDISLGLRPREISLSQFDKSSYSPEKRSIIV